MGINSIDANYSIYGQMSASENKVEQATENTEFQNDESIMTDKTKLKTVGTAVGIFGAAAATVATICAFKTGKANGHKGFKAIANGFKTIGGKTVNKLKTNGKKAKEAIENGVKKAEEKISKAKPTKNGKSIFKNIQEKTQDILTKMSNKIKGFFSKFSVKKSK